MKPTQRAADYLKEQIAASGLSRKEWYWKVYLKSEHWADLRKTALENAGHRCKNCQCTGPLDVDHIRYKSIFNVTQDDLQVLCRRCHEAEHAARRDIRQAGRKPRQPRSDRQQKESWPKDPVKQAKARMRKLAKLYKQVKKETYGTQMQKFEAGYAAVVAEARKTPNLSKIEEGYINSLRKNISRHTRKARRKRRKRNP